MKNADLIRASRDRNEDPDPDWQPIVAQPVAARMARMTRA